MAVISKSGWKDTVKYADGPRCQSIYMNLMRCMRSGTPTTAFLQEMQHTGKCDRVRDLSFVRRAIEKEMGTDALIELLNFSDNRHMLKIAEAAIVHHVEWTQAEVWKGLNIKNKIIYKLESPFEIGGADAMYKRLAHQER